MTPMNRREALIGLAAVPAATALGAGLTLTAAEASKVSKIGIRACKLGFDGRCFGIRVMNEDYEPEYSMGSIAVIDPRLAPKDGDLVLVRDEWRDFQASEHLFPYETRSGHDEHGRFCKPGDPSEIVVCFGGLICSRKDMERVHILGTARGCYVELPQGRNQDREFFQWVTRATPEEQAEVLAVIQKL
jgi:hypothetical protein